MSYIVPVGIPNLTAAEMVGARSLTLAATVDTAGGGSDVSAVVVGSEDFAILHSIYKINLVAGATYSFFTTSYFDPFVELLYDATGHPLAASNENEDPKYGEDVIFFFVAPYSGTYYVDASWNQGSFFKDYSFVVLGDLDTAFGGTILNDRLSAAAGRSEIHGATGNDTISGWSGTSYLRGNEGDDSIMGGSGFDDINGNMGNDTCVSGGGDDWVVGGKDNDSLVGSDGANLVYGNVGADTCVGGGGNDIVRGGQDNDLVDGGPGNDFVSGDKGDDTMTGGAGADIFHTFGDAGIDRVIDFHVAEGDRVQLDPGTVFGVSQVGADTVITMTGGGQMILVGVAMSTLPAGWIFGA